MLAKPVACGRVLAKQAKPQKQKGVCVTKEDTGVKCSWNRLTEH